METDMMKMKDKLYHYCRYKLDKTLHKYRLYKQSPYQIYHMGRDRDYYTLMEYPKCGRSWVRFMISYAESIQYNIPFRNTLHDIVYKDYSLPRVYYIHGFDKSKSLKEFHYKRMYNRYFVPEGIIMLVRQPERVMISYYYQCVYRDFIFKGSISDFIRDDSFGITKYEEYLKFYLSELKRLSLNYKIIKYEDLVADTFRVFSDLLTFVRINLSEEQIRKVIDESNFSKMQAIERAGKYDLHWLSARNKNNINSFKTRKKGTEEVKHVFDDCDIEFLKEKISKSLVFKELGYKSL